MTASAPEKSTRGSAPRFNRSSADAEMSLLSIIVNNPAAGPDLLTKCEEMGLEGERFSSPALGLVFTTLSSLYARNEAAGHVGISVLRAELERRNLTTRIGGLATLETIEARDVSSAAGQHFIDTIIHVSLARDMASSAHTVLAQLAEEGVDIAGVLDQYQGAVLRISEGATSSVSDLEDGVDAAVEDFKRRLNGLSTGVPTGIAPLDRLTFGLQPGQVVVIAARPSVGKTALALAISEHIADARPEKGGGTALIFSLEMSKRELAARLIASKSKCPLRIEENTLVNLSKISEAANKLKTLPLRISDDAGTTVMQMRAIARREKRLADRSGRKLRAIFVDYLQLVTPTDPKAPREQQVASMSRELKKMAKDLDVPVVVLSQLNRDSDKQERPPRLSDLRESGAIEQDADVVLLMSRKGEDVPGSTFGFVLCDVAKQRNGPVGEFVLRHDRPLNHFREAHPDEIFGREAPPPKPKKNERAPSPSP